MTWRDFGTAALALGGATLIDPAVAAEPVTVRRVGRDRNHLFADPKTDTVVALMFQRMMTGADDTAISNEFLKLALQGDA